MQDSIIESKQGPEKWEAAIKALSAQENLAPLTWLPELSLAAQDQCVS